MRPIKKASFKRCHVRRLGYPVSKHLWKGCGDARPRNKGEISMQRLLATLKRNINIFFCTQEADRQSINFFKQLYENISKRTQILPQIGL
jgi:hypothetical protein